MAERDFDSDFPFAGIRVIELAQGVAGPGAVGMLAAYGADVVKVEDVKGDWSRRLGRTFEGISGTFVASNRGKRSLALNLRSQDAHKILRKLATRADVLIQNFRPGIMDRLGLDDATLKSLNPELIYISLTGFGEEGPYRGRAATDSIVQAVSGILNLNRGSDGIPHKMPIPIVDMAAALNLFQAIAIALFVREKTGCGRHLRTSLLETAAWLQAGGLAEHVATGGKPPGKLAVPRAIIPTKDNLLAVVALEDDQFSRLCMAIGREEFAKDPRFSTADRRLANEAELLSLLKARFTEKTAAEWAQVLAAADVLHAPVNDYEGFLSDPQVAASSLFAWGTQPGMGCLPLPHVVGAKPFEDGDNAMRAPALGEHSRAVLEEIGLDRDEFERLHAEGIVCIDSVS